MVTLIAFSAAQPCMSQGNGSDPDCDASQLVCGFSADLKWSRMICFERAMLPPSPISWHRLARNPMVTCSWMLDRKKHSVTRMPMSW